MERYDAGLLNDFGGGDVGWWQDYIRAELERAHEFYASLYGPEALAARDARIEQLEADVARKDALMEKVAQAAIDKAADAVQYCVNGYPLDDIRALFASEIVKEMCGE